MRVTGKLLPVIVVVVMSVVTAYSQTKGIKVVSIRNDNGRQVDLYQRSYALLVGVSKYNTGWPQLLSVLAEIQKIKIALQSGGFEVQTVLDPNADQLKKAFEEFVKQYGYDTDSRLLFYFSGHGWSRKDGEQGYLVPIDAPDPRQNQKEFLRRALSMNQILTWCKEMDAKHVLFLFDSCFSGTIFRTKALPAMPPHITDLTVRPVRQFITAGDAGEEVPAKSVFATCFIQGLEGDADLSKDGYITGTELGMYLHDKVIYYQTGQTPQYGKIRDPQLDQGDFIFVKPEWPPSSQRPVQELQKTKTSELPEQSPIVSTPTSAGMDLNKYKNEAKLTEVKKQWQTWQEKMNASYQDALVLDQDGNLDHRKKAQMWQEFVDGYKEDNPYSQDDAGMRSTAAERLIFWKNYQPPQTAVQKQAVKELGETNGTVTDIDGHVYKTVKIGNQWWMAENLKVTHYRNGDAIFKDQGPPEIPKLKPGENLSKKKARALEEERAAYYAAEAFVLTYGQLYDWYTVNDRRGLAPEGWHIPSVWEWRTLLDCLGGISVAGGKLKNPREWGNQSPSIGDESGFRALPAGFRDENGIPNRNQVANFWTATEYDKKDAQYFSLQIFSTDVKNNVGPKKYSLSVRCIKN